MKERLNKIMVGCTTLALVALPTFAEATEAQTAIQTALTSTAAEVKGTILIALPIALGLIGMVFGIKKGIAFFKTLANKA